MIHPDTELRFVNNEIGYGVFATASIPKGTIVYVKDPLDIEMSQTQYDKLTMTLKQLVDKYSYTDENGVRIISWDHAKFVNHSCECNTMSSGYGFELAIRDITIDEEITDEYGMFNIPFPIKLHCNCLHCRKKLLPTDFDTYGEVWDTMVVEAIKHVPMVSQPLWEIIDMKTRVDLMGFVSGEIEYRSVFRLRNESQNNNTGRKQLLFR
jgi:hypothetical protein